MIEQIYTYFTIEMIYLWVNLGVLPFWLILFFFPQSKICKIFTTSIFPIFIFSLIYLYIIYLIFRYDYDFLNNFRLYLGMKELSNLFSDNSFLILFWIHFLAINLFCGAWIVNDYQKYGKTAQSQGATASTYDFIDTIVYVRGVNTNVVLQLPIRIIRAAQTS